jgi:divalent metal cation (Fe/Co/Zn/Cd) transporter
VPGVINCHSVRIRYSGGVFIDLHVLVDGRQTRRARLTK